jgi:hypothetical protein
MYGRLLGKVANDLVSSHSSGSSKRRFIVRQANGIDRPSFAASVIQNTSKHDLTELEQIWLVGNML